MGKCIKSIFLSVIAAIFGVIALSGPIFATSNSGNANTNYTETTVVTDVNDADATTNNPTDTTTTTGETTGEESAKPSCYDQVGGLGWIICPGAGLFGTIIDGAYNLLTQIIEVNPIPTDTSSPTYVVWEYFKDITNGLFIIFLLIVIFSQITGVGINNYGIKKALPRIVISAILVNLSYIICTIAVDLSNILGNAFQAFFVNVQNIAIQNGNLSSVASDLSVSSVVANMLGIGIAGAVGVGIAFAAFGGPGAVVWLLLPILLSGLVAVISAVVTMAARQALIYLLVMISPLALIAYMLPNTEKWYKKWYGMLAQMLFFYPMFSILYGASQLAGLVIITSATNWLGVVLGIAVKILPLFMSIPLMRMSNTMLGKISGVINRATARPLGAVNRYAASQAGLERQKQLNKRNPKLASTRLAQYLEKQRAKREFDTKELMAANMDRNLTASMQGWYRRNGKLNARGLRHYENERAKMDNATARMNIESDFDEGFATNGTDKRVRTRDLARVAMINNLYEKAIVNNAAAESRKRQVTLNNMEHRAQLIRQNVSKEGTEIHQRVLDAFHIDAARYDTLKSKKKAYDDAVLKQSAIDKLAEGKDLTNEEKAIIKEKGNTMTASELAAIHNGTITDPGDIAFYNAGQKAINATLADAITAKRKVDKEARANYLELYDDYEAGPGIKKQLIDAFQNKDYNSMSAALEVMYKRGDKDDIGEVLLKYSKEAKGRGDDDIDAIRFQKELNDVCLSFKAEDIDVAQWAKANMMRRGMNGKGKEIEAYIDYDKWSRGENCDGDVDKAAARKASRVELGVALSSWEALATADRTMWNQMLDAQKDGIIAKVISENGEEQEVLATYPIKYLRSAVCSGKMDGERLESFNKFFTGGLKMSYKEVNGKKVVDWDATMADAKNSFFFQHQDSYAENVEKFFTEMSANQLGTLKTATLNAFNNVLLAKYGHGADDITVRDDGTVVSNKLLEFLGVQINQFNTEKSMAGQRTAMNPAVRKMLGIKDVLDGGRNQNAA